jgi:hypothetical protein
MHQQEQDRWTLDNEQLIAVVSSKSSAKFATLLQGQVVTFHSQMELQKGEIVQSRESALKNIQEATDTLQGRMSFLEHEYQNSKMMTNHGDGDKKLSPTPKRKRGRKKTKQSSAATTSTSTHRSARNHHGGDDNDEEDDDYFSCPRVAACEAQLQEQRSEIAALRAMITSMTTPTFAATMAASSNSTTMHQVKMEENEVAAESGEILETPTNSVADAMAPEKKDALLATMEQELQRVQVELVASQETANRYKMKCEYYKDRMEQLGKLLKFQP